MNDKNEAFEDQPAALATEPEAPEAQPQEEADAPAEDAKTVTLRVSGPLNTRGVTLTTEDGDTLVLDTEGTEVAADQVEDLTLRAALAGVTLTREDN